MTVQCLYQNDPKDAAAVLGQRNACRRAANKLGWLIQQERICDASEGTPLLLRPDAVSYTHLDVYKRQWL